MDYQTQIEEVLTQAITEKTFSLEIIEKIKSLKDGFEANKKLVDSLNERIESLVTNNKQLSFDLNNARIKLDTYLKREEEILKKEKELDRNNYELQFQKNRANEIKELMMIVFKNPIVRKSTFLNNNDYGTSKTTNGGETQEIE